MDQRLSLESPHSGKMQFMDMARNQFIDHQTHRQSVVAHRCRSYFVPGLLNFRSTVGPIVMVGEGLE